MSKDSLKEDSVTICIGTIGSPTFDRCRKTVEFIAKKLSFNDCVVLSTAHPCKFPDATKNAINKHEELPKELAYVLHKEENFQILRNDIEEVKKFVKSKI